MAHNGWCMARFNALNTALYNVKFFVIKFINEIDVDILSKQTNRFVITLF